MELNVSDSDKITMKILYENETYINDLIEELKESYVKLCKVHDPEKVFWIMTKVLLKFGICPFRAINMVTMAINPPDENAERTMLFSMIKTGEYIMGELEAAADRIDGAQKYARETFSMDLESAKNFVCLCIDLANVNNGNKSKYTKEERLIILKMLADSLIKKRGGE